MSLAEDLKRTLGFHRQDDRAKAAQYMETLSRSHDPEARLATGIAAMLVPSERGRRVETDGMVRITIPSLSHDPRPMPTDPVLRRMHIAKAVLESADRHIRQGSDEGLSPDLGRAARTETVRQISVGDLRQHGLDSALARRSEERARTVAAYLSNGPAIEKHMEKLLAEIPQRGEVSRTAERIRDVREFHPSRQPPSGPELKNWIRDGLKAERIAARAGLMSPDRVVRTAERTMKGADIEMMSTLPRARPDFEAGRSTDANARRRMFSEATKDMAQTRTSTSPTPVRGTEIARSSHDRQAALQMQAGRMQMQR